MRSTHPPDTIPTSMPWAPPTCVHLPTGVRRAGAAGMPDDSGEKERDAWFCPSSSHLIQPRRLAGANQPAVKGVATTGISAGGLFTNLQKSMPGLWLIPGAIRRLAGNRQCFAASGRRPTDPRLGAPQIGGRTGRCRRRRRRNRCRNLRLRRRGRQQRQDCNARVGWGCFYNRCRYGRWLRFTVACSTGAAAAPSGAPAVAVGATKIQEAHRSQT